MTVNEIIDVKHLVQYLVCGNRPPPQEKNNKQNIKPQSSLEKILEKAYYCKSLPLGKIFMCKIYGIRCHSSYSLRSHPTHLNRLLSFYMRKELHIPLRLKAHSRHLFVSRGQFLRLIAEVRRSPRFPQRS